MRWQCFVVQVHIGVATDELVSNSQGLYHEMQARRRDSEIVAPRTETVSYTHLDVYKRQKQYCVKNPVLPFIQDSPTYMKDGEMLDRMLADARVRYIIGEIDEENLEQLWDAWREMGGSQLIEEVNALYKVRR